VEFLRYFSPEALGIENYAEIWAFLLDTLFSGFFSRVLAWSCLVLFIYGIVRMRFSLLTSFALYAVAIAVAYGSSIWGVINGKGF